MKGFRSAQRRSSPRQPNLPGLTEPAKNASYRRFISSAEHALDRARLRIVVVLFMFVLMYGAIGAKLATLSLMSDAPEIPEMRASSGEMSMVSRADIVDRNGTVLATSLPTVSLCADARRVLDSAEAIEKLKEVLPGLDTPRLTKELEGSKRCAPIRRHLTPRQYYAINKLGIAGLEFSPDETRVYPVGRLTAHVLGYTDIDSKGIAGIEKSMNTQLQRSPQPVELALDLRLQTIVQRELRRAIEEFRAQGAAGVIMDASSGEILSLVSLPDFDPQIAGEADDNAKFNRATLGVYEMGSTFKVFTTALALESGLIKPSDRFDTTHPLEVGGRTIRDFHPSQKPLSVAEIFMESSNIGAAKMADKLGSGRQRAFLGRLGLMEKVPLELPEVGAPLVPAAANWNNATTMTVAFGHGIAVNAVQITAAIANIINAGIPVRPTLMKHPRPPGAPENEKDRIVSARTTAQMRALMRLVVKEGTAKAAEIAGYSIGGKTGTADKIINGQYNKNARLSSFIGVFPISAPRYLVFAMLDNPAGNAKTRGYATGGWTAAPVVGRIISQMGPLMDLPPQDPDVLAATERQLLRPLGTEVLNSLRLNKEMDDYASVESNTAE